MKKLKYISLLLLCSIFFTACSVKDSNKIDDASNKNPDKAAAENLEEVDLVLDWYPNAIHAFIYAAIENGYYEEEGLKVNVKFPSNPTDSLALPTYHTQLTLPTLPALPNSLSNLSKLNPARHEIPRRRLFASWQIGRAHV